MPSAAPTETELKLQLAPPHIDRFRRAAALSKAACTEVGVDNVYLDTSDRLLQRSKMALRLRRIGRRWVQTLKTGAESRGAVSRRSEWETPARVLRGQGRLDLKQLSSSPLATLLAKQKGDPALRPVFRTRFKRSLWTVERAGALVEVALDVGEITTVVTGKVLREPICEVELELKKDGNQSASIVLIDLALEMLDAGGKQPVALTPVARSKAERGYQLAAQRPPTAAKASAKGFVSTVSSGDTIARALRAVVAHGLASLMCNVELLMRYDDPEYVHQSRVALRRVRSAIRLFDREHRDLPKPLAEELRWFARALGEARDWDVITDQTLPSLVDSIGADKELVTRANRLRDQAREEIREAARSTRYAALVLSGERWCVTPEPAGPAQLADAAAPALQSASRRLFKAARFFSALTHKRRHEVRILAKRLRYALDLFAVVLSKQATAQYIESLSELQDVLGELNDAWVATTVLPQLSKSARLKSSARGWLASIEPDQVRQAERGLLKLSKMETPWP